jgi:hypothetical protein
LWASGQAVRAINRGVRGPQGDLLIRVNLTLPKRDGKGQSPRPGSGVSPEHLFSSFLHAACGGVREKKVLGDIPIPGREGPAPLKLTPMGDLLIRVNLS